MSFIIEFLILVYIPTLLPAYRSAYNSGSAGAVESMATTVTATGVIRRKTLTDDLKFPDDFKFGASTAAYQIEGAWKEDGKGPSNWDVGVHDFPDRIIDGSNADIGPDSYHRFTEDIKALKEVGFNFYRFSIAWTRILPTGDIANINQKGIDFYHRVIDELLANGIQPLVTMHHYDTPAALEKLGGLTNPLFADYFEDYADLLFKTYGSKVKHWITFNEPIEVCLQAYGNGTYPPFTNASGVGEYLCAHHVLISHARAYHLYDTQYRSDQDGKLGISLNSRFLYPKNPKEPKDVEAAQRALTFFMGWFADPIFSQNGGYPPLMIEEIAKNSLREGRRRSRLPDMSENLKSYIKGTADFFAFNYYTSRYAEPEIYADNMTPGFMKDMAVHMEPDPTWPRSNAPWLYSVPQGLEDVLKYIQSEYDPPEIIITENGYSDAGQLEDNERISYLRDHLKAILRARVSDGVKITGYTVWSIIDNFEWLFGYTNRFGLYKIDFDSEDRTRIPKKSSKFMKEVITNRSIPEEF